MPSTLLALDTTTGYATHLALHISPRTTLSLPTVSHRAYQELLHRSACGPWQVHACRQAHGGHRGIWGRAGEHAVPLWGRAGKMLYCCEVGQVGMLYCCGAGQVGMLYCCPKCCYVAALTVSCSRISLQPCFLEVHARLYSEGSLDFDGEKLVHRACSGLVASSTCESRLLQSK